MADLKEKSKGTDEVFEPKANQEQLDQLAAAAKEAYESTKVAFEADKVPLDLLTSWSSKLLEADLLAARSPTQRVQAFEA